MRAKTSDRAVLRTTLAEVARRAKVSEMTVSRVLRNKGNVAVDTRRRVLEVVASLGYVPNRLAGALASASTGLIAVIIPSLGNIVFPEVLRGINERLESAGLQSVVGISDYQLSKEGELVEAMLSWRPAGIIVTGIEHTPRARRFLAESGLPVVEVMDIDGTPVDMAVGMSNASAGNVMGRHLVARGYRRIGYIGCDLTLDLRAAKRLDGFRRALAEAGIGLAASLIVPLPSSPLQGRTSLAELLDRNSDLDAVYFSNDDMAAGGLMHCLAARIDVPRRLAIAGFNGLEIGEAMPLRLTTVRSPRYAIGRHAAQCVLDRLSGLRPPDREDVGFEFVEGETA